MTLRILQWLRLPVFFALAWIACGFALMAERGVMLGFVVGVIVTAVLGYAWLVYMMKDIYR